MALKHKKWHMTNIYLTDSDQGAIVDFVKDQKELYYKTNEHFKDKARGNVSPTVASCLSSSVRPGLIHKGHVTASSCNPGLVRPQKEMTERQNLIQDKFNFLKMHIRSKDQHTTPVVQLTWRV